MGENKNTTDLSGVASFFNDYQASRPPNTEPVKVQESKPAPTKEPTSPRKQTSGSKVSKTAKTRKPESTSVKARQGRPPGVKAGSGPLREKATFYVSKKLMNDYRNWSWEQRMNVGPLIEKALADYKRRYFKSESQ